jgi:hypothetical protein
LTERFSGHEKIAVNMADQGDRYRAHAHP